VVDIIIGLSPEQSRAEPNHKRQTPLLSSWTCRGPPEPLISVEEKFRDLSSLREKVWAVQNIASLNDSCLSKKVVVVVEAKRVDGVRRSGDERHVFGDIEHCLDQQCCGQEGV
jgi:hypothetical protein